MKKFLSVIIALMMAVSVSAVAVSAFAVESPTAGPAVSADFDLRVNGKSSSDVHYTEKEVDGKLEVTFTYDGDDEFLGWEDNLDELGFVEGVDYEKVVNEDGSLTLTFVSDAAIQAAKTGKVVVNALVKTADGVITTVKPTTNDSSKSPSTGVATSVIAGSIAVAGAGIAVLSATKKKDAE